jgi:fructose/tagatose bisphosphate aldolase
MAVVQAAEELKQPIIIQVGPLKTDLFPCKTDHLILGCSC